MHQSFRKSKILMTKVLKVQKPLFFKEYASNSWPESVHMQTTVSQSMYTHGMKEEKARTTGGSHEDLSVSWCQVLEV